MLSSLQRHNTKNSKQIFPEKALRGLSPYFHIHMSVSDLYIPTIRLPILLILGIYCINRSQIHESGNWERGHSIPFLRKHKSDYCWSAGLSLQASEAAFYVANQLQCLL
jgi:hypothetical protein